MFLRFKLVFLYFLRFFCSPIDEEDNKEGITLFEISTLGYIKLTDNDTKNIEASLEYDKNIKHLVNQRYLKCIDIINIMIKSLQDDLTKISDNPDLQFPIFSKLEKRAISSFEDIKNEVDDIFKGENDYFSVFLQNSWQRYNREYPLKLKKQYIKRLNEEINHKEIIFYDRIVNLTRNILTEFAKSYLKRAIFMVAMFFNDKKAILGFLSNNKSSIFFQESNAKYPANDSFIYKVIEFICKKNNKVETIKRKISNDEILDNVLGLLKNIFYRNKKKRKKSLKLFFDGFPPDFYSNPYSKCEFKAEAKIKNLFPIFKKYIECLLWNKNFSKGVNILFIEIDLNTELNQAFENKEQKYILEFKHAFWSFLNFYKMTNLVDYVKVVFIWKEVKIKSFFKTINTISEEDTIKWIEINRIRFLRKISRLYDYFEKHCDGIFTYKLFNEPDEDVSEDSNVSRDKFLEATFAINGLRDTKEDKVKNKNILG